MPTFATVCLGINWIFNRFGGNQQKDGLAKTQSNDCVLQFFDSEEFLIPLFCGPYAKNPRFYFILPVICGIFVCSLDK